MGFDLGAVLGGAGTLLGGPVGGIIGTAAGGILGGIFGDDKGDAQQQAGQQQTQLGQNIFDYANESGQPYVDAGHDALQTQQGLLNRDWRGSGAPEYAWMGEDGITNPNNPFAAHNFLDDVEEGDQAYDWNRTLGEYGDSNAFADNQAIMDRTMEKYGNSVLGGQLSGKALSGAIRTAARTNAGMRDQWASRQMAAAQNSVNAGRGGTVQDISRRRQNYGDLRNLASQGLSAIGTVTHGTQAGAGMMNQGNLLTATGEANSSQAWGNAIGNGLDSISTMGRDGAFDGWF